MKLLYGTNNRAKVAHIREFLADLPIELLSLSDMETRAPDVEETGANLLENARLKAEAYYKFYRMPVFSCDIGLYFEGLPEESQPGTHTRRVGGKTVSDPEMTAYYASLAERFGGITAQYRGAICLILDETHRYECDDERVFGWKFRMISTPHPRREVGFPLDCISTDIESGNYVYDMDRAIVERNTVTFGLARFIKDTLRLTANS